MTKPKQSSLLFRAWISGTVHSSSLVEICADDADASFLGLDPGSSTFWDKPPTFTWKQG